ncbi:hypothetical protein [Ralstonia pseudosolanacearum]|uniref:hypothetical protein n=1 Tax=Ralstonia pseudosolanacearum TaxID=1310165 RepID=UPI003CF7E987
MGHPDQPHIVHRYRYLDVRTGRWKTTRHHMSAEEAERFFAPGKSTHFTAKQWEPIESSREERVATQHRFDQGIQCHPFRHGRLTVEELRKIWEHNKCSDVRRLMWEISYLRGTIEWARHLAAVLEVSGIEPPFDDYLRQLVNELRYHPSPPPLIWSAADEAALKRIARARR